jgi:hypothetical protein
MIELSFRIFPNLKNDRIQPATHPTDGAMLGGKVGALVAVIRMIENLLYLLEADSALRISPKPFALTFVEMESHKV